jgi:hypothetical protein
VAEEQFEGLVLFNEGDNFSVGANLMLVAMGRVVGVLRRHRAARGRCRRPTSG